MSHAEWDREKKTYAVTIEKEIVISSYTQHTYTFVLSMMMNWGDQIVATYTIQLRFVAYDAEMPYETQSIRSKWFNSTLIAYESELNEHRSRNQICVSLLRKNNLQFQEHSKKVKIQKQPAQQIDVESRWLANSNKFLKSKFSVRMPLLK